MPIVVSERPSFEACGLYTSTDNVVHVAPDPFSVGLHVGQ